jgi:hypothetical protein
VETRVTGKIPRERGKFSYYRAEKQLRSVQ